MAAPQFTGSADQRYFLEPLDGGVNMAHYLRRFPDAVYNKAPDSHLLRFMYAILGPTGIGWLKRNIAEARLVLEASGAQFGVLDSMYGIPLSFPRLPFEVYTEDISGMQVSTTWQAIRAQDEAYRSRVIEFLHGVRLGGTVEGLQLVASAGAGQPIDVVENYRYLFDAHSDDPLGIPYQGSSLNLGEFILLPRPTVSQSIQQVIRFDLVQPPVPYTIAFNGPSATFPLSTTASQLQGTPGSGGLTDLRTIGTGNIIVSGGPAPAPFTILFTGSLSNQPLPTLQVYWGQVQFQASAINGSNVLTHILSISGLPGVGQALSAPASLVGATVTSMVGTTCTLSEPYQGPSGIQTFTAATYIPVTVSTGVTDPSAETVVLSDAAQHEAQTAVDLLRPVPTIPSWYQAHSKHRVQPWQTILASTEYTEVVRFVTGSPNVPWPQPDSMHWIEASIENQAPQLSGTELQHYVNFHNVESIQAYTDAALSDPAYATNSAVLPNYNSVHVGPFPEMASVMPYFKQFATDYSTVFSANQALADYPEQLRVTGLSDSGIAVINRTYPADYTDLQGVPSLVYTEADFWSSTARASGADILEIDLGSAQAVNYISLEVTRKPITIAIDYDLPEQAPARTFIPVTMVPGYPTALSVFYDPSQQNPWEHLTFYFNDGENMIYTRFIRLTFTRLAGLGFSGRFLFDYQTNTQTPWSIDVRNLRVGRNVAPSVV